MKFQAAPSSRMLVVLTPRFDGWSVRVDGLPWGLRNVDGFLAVPTQAGKHLYTFTYDSWLFKLGLVNSIGAMIVTGWMLLADRLALRVPGFRI